MNDVFDYEFYTPGIGDYLLTPIYIFIFYTLAKRTERKHIDNPIYKYYSRGLLVKLLSGVIFCLIYALYYHSGDTINYFLGGQAVARLIPINFDQFWTVFTNRHDECYYYFNAVTGWPALYMWRDPNSFFVIKLIAPLSILGFGCYLPTTMILGWLSYFGVWKLYVFFTDFYPELKRQMAICVLFIPSVVFWGSGIMKDTLTFSCECWFIYSIYFIAVKRKNIFSNLIVAGITSFVILSVKAYIFVALMPGTLIWVFFSRISKIRNPFLKIFSFPFIIAAAFLLISTIFSSLSSQMGEYASLDKMVEKAQVTKEDLTREQAYGKNYYDVGHIDNSLIGLIKKAPIAITAGLFRPFIWEVRNPVMLLSGIENAILVIFTLLMFRRLKIIGFFTTIFSEPLIVFSFTFSMFFTFGIGLSAANFGALVRYKIPAMPFYLATLFIMNYIYNKPKIESVET